MSGPGHVRAFSKDRGVHAKQGPSQLPAATLGLPGAWWRCVDHVLRQLSVALCALSCTLLCRAASPASRIQGPHPPALESPFLRPALLVPAAYGVIAGIVSWLIINGADFIIVWTLRKMGRNPRD